MFVQVSLTCFRFFPILLSPQPPPPFSLHPPAQANRVGVGGNNVCGWVPFPHSPGQIRPLKPLPPTSRRVLRSYPNPGEGRGGGGKLGMAFNPTVSLLFLWTTDEEEGQDGNRARTTSDKTENCCVGGSGRGWLQGRGRGENSRSFHYCLYGEAESWARVARGVNLKENCSIVEDFGFWLCARARICKMKVIKHFCTNLRCGLGATHKSVLSFVDRAVWGFMLWGKMQNNNFSTKGTLRFLHCFFF